ncbi:MAG: hypothetical protein OES09_11295 [Gammaproteobacteria bacterium]|nr:hypothetical protein [Gammaproteobacteria bacterium]
MTTLEHIVLHRLQIPLREPYILSIKTIGALDTLPAPARRGSCAS